MDGDNQSEIKVALQSTGMMADVSISTWSGAKSDNDLLDGVNPGGTNKSVKTHTITRNLMAGRDAKLKAARSAYHAIRLMHYERTLPLVSDPHSLRNTGPRLLTYPHFNGYMQTMAGMKGTAIQAKDEFVMSYPQDSLEANEIAKQRMGTAYTDVVYPTQDEVDAAFRIHFDIDPIPDSSAFSSLPEQALAGLRRNYEEKQERLKESAVKAAWGECRGRVEYLIGRLTATDSDGDPAVFRNSTIESVKELLELMPGWNITGSQQVTEVVDDIRKMLDSVKPDDLRKDSGLRNTTARQAQQVIDKMARWGV